MTLIWRQKKFITRGKVKHSTEASVVGTLTKLLDFSGSGSSSSLCSNAAISSANVVFCSRVICNYVCFVVVKKKKWESYLKGVGLLYFPPVKM